MFSVKFEILGVTVHIMASADDEVTIKITRALVPVQERVIVPVEQETLEERTNRTIHHVMAVMDRDGYIKPISADDWHGVTSAARDYLCVVKLDEAGQEYYTPTNEGYTWIVKNQIVRDNQR